MMLDTQLTASTVSSTPVTHLGGVLQGTVIGATWNGGSATPQWSPDNVNWFTWLKPDGTSYSALTADATLLTVLAPGFVRWTSSGVTVITVKIDKASAQNAVAKFP